MSPRWPPGGTPLPRRGAPAPRALARDGPRRMKDGRQTQGRSGVPFPVEGGREASEGSVPTNTCTPPDSPPTVGPPGRTGVGNVCSPATEKGFRLHPREVTDDRPTTAATTPRLLLPLGPVDPPGPFPFRPADVGPPNERPPGRVGGVCLSPTPRLSPSRRSPSRPGGTGSLGDPNRSPGGEGGRGTGTRSTESSLGTPVPVSAPSVSPFFGSTPGFLGSGECGGCRDRHRRKGVLLHRAPLPTVVGL